ncbi:MAG: VWA domain-containing protein [Planctomycetes bacterium]|nr:VWA domain-containing protein [Planctomycetota bacterium]
MRFESPWSLLLLGLILLGLVVRLLMVQAGFMPRPGLLFSNLGAFLRQPRSWRLRASRGLGLLRVLACVAIVVALARPQIGRKETLVRSEGIDIVLAIDGSGSMMAEDFGGSRTRLEHVSDVAREFIKKRVDDRLGIVTFGEYAYTRCPMTLDVGLVADFMERSTKDWLQALDSYQRKKAGLIDEPLTPRERDLEGTAIGDGLLTAISRLEDSKAKSKVVVLLSDGAQTAGETSPADAAALAKRFGVKVYTIGAGSDRPSVVTLYDRLGRKHKATQAFLIDEATLKEIAETTGGRYFHADDRAALEAVYDEIDRLEKTEISSRNFREWDERFPPLVWLALALMAVEALLGATILRRLP